MTKYKYTTEYIEHVKFCVKTSSSIRQVLGKLGLKMAGGNYATFHSLKDEFNIDISHFTGQSWLKGKSGIVLCERPLSEILVEKSNFTSTYSLKNKLIKHKLLENKCSNNNCGIKNWHGEKLSLHLDHINGVRNDNRIENLRLLCPNCHSQTSTYCGKNKKNITIPKKEISKRDIKQYFCIDCNIALSRDSKRCKRCYGMSQRGKFVKSKIEWPTKEVLEKLVWQNPTKNISKQLGVSDSAIAKRCKKFGITKPDRGYWAKKVAGKI